MGQFNDVVWQIVPLRYINVQIELAFLFTLVSNRILIIVRVITSPIKGVIHVLYVLTIMLAAGG